MQKVKKLMLQYITTCISFCLFGVLYGVNSMLDYDYRDMFGFDLDRVGFCAFLCGIGAFLIETLFVKRQMKEKKTAQKVLWTLGKLISYIISIISSVLMAHFLYVSSYDTYFGGVKGSVLSDMAENFSMGYILICLAVGVYFVYVQRKSENAEMTLGEYVSRVFANLFIIFIIYFVLLIGGLLVAGVADELLSNGNYELVPLWIYCVTGCYLFPATILGITNVDKELGKFTRVVIHYIYPVLTLCTVFLVYLYVAKILIKWEVPSNEVYGIISTLFCFCMPVWLMAESLKKKNVYSKILSALIYFFAPLMLLQIYCIGVRIYEYGMTAERYLGVMLIVFEIITIIVGIIWKNKREIYLLIFGGLTLIAVFVPNYNMHSFSNMWQYGILKSTYEKVEAGYAITEEEYERLDGAYNYLVHQEETRSIANKYNIYDDDFIVKLIKNEEVAEEITQIEDYYISFNSLISELDISEYDKVSLCTESRVYYDGAGNFISDVSLEDFEFVTVEGKEIFYADVSGFVEKCIRVDKEYPTLYKNSEIRKKIGDLNIITVDNNRILCIQAVCLDYEEGVKQGEDYWKWNDVNFTGFLLEKNPTEESITAGEIEKYFTKTWQRIYHNTLNEWNKENNSAQNQTIKYALSDVDNNDVPELIKVNLNSADGTVLEVEAYIYSDEEFLQYENELITTDTCTDEYGQFFMEIGYERMQCYDCDTLLPILEYEAGVGAIYEKNEKQYEPFRYPDWEVVIEDMNTQVYSVYADGIDKEDIGYISLGELLKPGVLTTMDSNGLYIADFELYQIGKEITVKNACVLYLKEEKQGDVKHTVVLNKEEDIIYAYCIKMDGTWELLGSESSPNDIFYNGTDVIAASFYGNECYTYYEKNYTIYRNQVCTAEQVTATYLPDVETVKENLPPNIGINTVCQGDIGNDGKNDIAVVFEYVEKPEEDDFYPYMFNDRVVRIYTENDQGQYECRFANDFIILNKHYGGIFGDPFSDIKIEDGLLVITHYGGSADRWGNKEFYELNNDKLYNCKCIRWNHSTYDTESYEEITYEYDETDSEYVEFESRW